MDKDNPKFDSRDDCNAIIETKTNTLLFGCCNTKIPPSVKKIGRDSFFKCTSLKSIKIPHRITAIESGAFYGCIGLTSVKIPPMVKAMDSGVFSGCINLRSATLSDDILLHFVIIISGRN